MNRFFGITGFLAATFAAFCAFCIAYLPWIDLRFTDTPRVIPIWVWLLWGAMVAIGVSAVSVFLWCSLKSHWASLKTNAVMSSAAWRGVLGSYLICGVIFGLPLYSRARSGTNQIEQGLYLCLAGCCLLLGMLAAKRGFCDKRKVSVP